MGEGVLRAVPGPGDGPGPRPGGGPGQDEGHDEPLMRDLVGAALRRARLRQGRTLRDVADRARVSLPYLSEIERGRKEPSSEVLAAVCRALGLHLVDLVGALHTDLTSVSTVTVSVTTRATAHWGGPRRSTGARRDGQAMGVLLAA
ncbi:helix-turn-helix domain-containing protein [Streptomyces sp. NPDC058653]|uniref:helix-turn-helix domain-containing protein n=1 Tax=Streptomyces sp. NPDC058653 TaxID=3346576 RepID=UPI0036671488